MSQKLLLPFLLMLGSFYYAPAQNFYYGFSESGLIHESNAGGSIWKLQTDGSSFVPIHTFNTEKGFKPIDEMVIHPDGQFGYGLAKGLDEDKGSVVLYRFNFTTNKPEIIKTFYGWQQASGLLLGQDQQLYLCLYDIQQGITLYQVAPDGSSAVAVHSFTQTFLNWASIFVQMPDGKLLTGILTTESDFTFYAGNTDGSSWEIVSLQPAIDFGFAYQNAVQWPDGNFYGAIKGNAQMAGVYKITPDYNISLLYQAPESELGANISLNRGADDAFYLLSKKNGDLLIQRMQDETSSPVPFYTANATANIQGPMLRGLNGDLYYMTLKSSQPTQLVNLYRVNFGNQSVDLIETQSLPAPFNSYFLSPLFLHPGLNRLFFWRYFDFSLSLDDVTLASCNPDGSAYEATYTLPAEPSENGHHPGAMILGSDKKIYAILTHGGAHQYGSIIAMDTTGANFTVLHSLQAPAVLSAWNRKRISHLFEGSDGLLYGSVGDGLLFRLKKDGSSFTVIKSDLEPGAYAVELNDGKIYIGGSKLLRIDKDGSNPLVVNNQFIHPFYPSLDFCRIFSLSDGDIAGVASRSYDDGVDFVTDGILFSYSLQNHGLKTKINYFVRSHQACLSPDDRIYFGSGYYYGAFNQSSYVSYDILCLDETPNLDPVARNDVYFKEPGGNIVGKRNQTAPAGPTWMPMVWDAEGATCKMSRPWDLSMGYHGHFAFAGYATTTGTTQPAPQASARLFPNPAHQGCALQWSAPQAETWTVTSTDLTGKLLWQTTVNGQSGENKLDIPAEAFPGTGCYLITLQSASGRVQLKACAF